MLSEEQVWTQYEEALRQWADALARKDRIYEMIFGRVFTLGSLLELGASRITADLQAAKAERLAA